MNPEIEKLIAEAFPCICPKKLAEYVNETHGKNCPARHRPAAIELVKGVVGVCAGKAKTSKGYPTNESEAIRALLEEY